MEDVFANFMRSIIRITARRNPQTHIPGPVIMAVITPPTISTRSLAQTGVVQSCKRPSVASWNTFGSSYRLFDSDLHGTIFIFNTSSLFPHPKVTPNHGLRLCFGYLQH